MVYGLQCSAKGLFRKYEKNEKKMGYSYVPCASAAQLMDGMMVMVMVIRILSFCCLYFVVSFFLKINAALLSE